MAEQLARALHPSITDVNVHWKTSQTIVDTAPKQAPPVFIGDRLLFYALLDESTPFDHTTTVELISKGCSQPLGVARLDRIPPVLTVPTVTRLAAKALLRELQHAPNERLVELSLRYGILCPQTAFVGIERRLDVNVNSNADMQLREVPILVGPESIYRMQYLQSHIEGTNTLMAINLPMALDRSEALISHATPRSFASIFQPAVNYLSSLFVQKSITVPRHEVSSARREVESGWPSDERRLVERLIERQEFDGTWAFADDDVQQLTGKDWSQLTSASLEVIDVSSRRVIMTTAIGIAVLERRCATLHALWKGISKKARQRLIVLMQGDQTRVEQLIKDILDQLL